jgi:hypothetical protein
MTIKNDWVELLKIREKALSTIVHQTLEEKYVLLLSVRATELCIDAISLLEKDRIAGVPIILRSAIETYINLINVTQDSSHIDTMQLSFNHEMGKFLKTINPTEATQYKIKGKKGPFISELFKNAGESKAYEMQYAYLCWHSHANIGALVPSHSIDGKILLGTTQDPDFIKLNTLMIVTLFALTLKETLNQFKPDPEVIQSIEAIIQRIDNDPFMVKFHGSKKPICTENPTSSNP